VPVQVRPPAPQFRIPIQQSQPNCMANRTWRSSRLAVVLYESVNCVWNLTFPLQIERRQWRASPVVLSFHCVAAHAITWKAIVCRHIGRHTPAIDFEAFRPRLAMSQPKKPQRTPDQTLQARGLDAGRRECLTRVCSWTSNA